MKTPAPQSPARPRIPARNSWRDMVQSGADCAAIEGFALEQLIDLQRARATQAGDRE